LGIYISLIVLFWSAVYECHINGGD